ncbi:MAG: VWA domain-containing protein, partial [Phycisphaerae bacterium]
MPLFSDDADVVLPFTPWASERRTVARAIHGINLASGTNLKAPLRLADTLLPAYRPAHVIMLTDGCEGGD